jgi:hypothetical protein
MSPKETRKHFRDITRSVRRMQNRPLTPKPTELEIWLVENDKILSSKKK